jgi:exopolyphosphatase/guanosine-5'-triphosphate,3'-diphosphate pyrophosphatase
MPNKKSEIRGCIDMGSSYFRLLVAESGPDGRAVCIGERGSSGRGTEAPAGRQLRDDIRILLDDKVYVGWGAALSRDGMLLSGEMDRAGRALSSLVSRASEAGCCAPAIVGTNTLRQARNRDEALGRLTAAARMRVTVLSQKGEAALGFLGASTIADPDVPVLQIDVGGTSTEIVWGRAGVMSDYIGIPWGTHAVRAVIPRGGPHRALAALGGMMATGPSGSQASVLYRLPGSHHTDTILCTGGTAVSLAVILNYTRRIRPLFRERETVSRAELEFLLRRIWRFFEGGRKHRLPLERERLNLLLPGMILFTFLVREMGVQAFSVTSRDIRWGGIITGDHLTEYSIDGRRDR